MNKKMKDPKSRVVDMEKKGEVYIMKKPFFLKLWWDNYLKRLIKITDGKPQCCK